MCSYIALPITVAISVDEAKGCSHRLLESMVALPSSFVHIAYILE